MTIMPRHRIIGTLAVYAVLVGSLVPRVERSEAMASAGGAPGNRARTEARGVDRLDRAIVRIKQLLVPPFELTLGRTESINWPTSSFSSIGVVVLVTLDAEGNVLDAEAGPIRLYGDDGEAFTEISPVTALSPAPGVTAHQLARVAVNAALQSELALDDAVKTLPGRTNRGEIEIRWAIPHDLRLPSGVAKVHHGESGDVAILDDPVLVTGSIQPPELIVKVNPDYPPDAREARAEGRIVLEAVIDWRGSVTRTEVVRGHSEFPSLEKSAEDAVRRWRYKPAMDANGHPVTVYFTVVVEYKMK